MCIVYNVNSAYNVNSTSSSSSDGGSREAPMGAKFETASFIRKLK